MKREITGLLFLAVAVYAVTEDKAKAVSKEEHVVYVCPEEGSYCVPRPMCPFRLVSYDYGVQMKMDSTKVRSDVACGRIAPTDNHVCCLQWDRMVDYEWEPSETSWFYKELNPDGNQDHEPTIFPLWPDFEGSTTRHHRHIGKKAEDKDTKVELDATPDSNSTDSVSETPQNTTDLVEDDDDEWIIIHPISHIPPPMINHHWPHIPPVFRFLQPQVPFAPLWTRFLPDQQLQPFLRHPVDPLIAELLPEVDDFHQPLIAPPLWTRFLPPGEHFRPPLDPLIMLQSNGVPAVDPVLTQPEPKVAPDGGEAVAGEKKVLDGVVNDPDPSPYHFSYATSQVRVGGRLFSKTRVQDGEKAHEEVVVL